jgi:hypothetical protein
MVTLEAGAREKNEAMTQRGKRAPRKPSAALTAALEQIAALQLENLTIGELKAKIAALEHEKERKWQPIEVECARIAELEPRLTSAEAALAQWLKIIPWSGLFPNPSRSHFAKYPKEKGEPKKKG